MTPSTCGGRASAAGGTRTATTEASGLSNNSNVDNAEDAAFLLALEQKIGSARNASVSVSAGGNNNSAHQPPQVVADPSVCELPSPPRMSRKHPRESLEIATATTATATSTKKSKVDYVCFIPSPLDAKARDLGGDPRFSCPVVSRVLGDMNKKSKVEYICFIPGPFDAKARTLKEDPSSSCTVVSRVVGDGVFAGMTISFTSRTRSGTSASSSGSIGSSEDKEDEEKSLPKRKTSKLTTRKFYPCTGGLPVSGTIVAQNSNKNNHNKA